MEVLVLKDKHVMMGMIARLEMFLMLIVIVPEPIRILMVMASAMQKIYALELMIPLLEHLVMMVILVLPEMFMIVIVTVTELLLTMTEMDIVLLKIQTIMMDVTLIQTQVLVYVK